MNKPEALVQLVEELRSEKIESSVESMRNSHVVVYTDPKAADQEDGIKLEREDCMLIFTSTGNVERFIEALGEPEEASLVLHDLIIPTDVLDELEKRFLAVDEA